MVETFSDPPYRARPPDVQPDFMGRAYEYLIRKLAGVPAKAHASSSPRPRSASYRTPHAARPGDAGHDYALRPAGLLVDL